MKPPNPFHETLAPQRVPNDGEPTVFASPDRRTELPGAITQETKINDRNRGLFAIADGALSTVGGAAAGLTVAAELELRLGASLDIELERLAKRPRALTEERVKQDIQFALMEAHRRLSEANQMNPRLRMRAQASIARVIDTPSSSEKELFFALSGKECLYLVRNGNVSRLGTQDGTVVVDRPGVLGEDNPVTVVHQASLEPGDRLVLLGDGAARALRDVDIQEAVAVEKNSRALERDLQEFAKRRVEAPQNHDAKAGEISVVCWEAFPMLKKTAFVENHAMELDARRPILQVRLQKIAADIERTKVLAKPDASGRQLIGAEETLVRLEAERAAATLELLNLDVPPRFKKGDRVSVPGATWDVKDISGGKYVLYNQRSDQTWLPSRWEFEKSLPTEDLPVHPGDRIRVSGFTATQKDDWHVMDTTQPADRFLFEDGAQDKHMAVPAGLTRQALHDMISEGRTLQNQAFALKRHAEKSKKGI